ncbi:RNA recognition motif domain-containing protein [Zhouia sp. PK063]|uniref:RNA recognition motif domain-containing protein n=1 Tax=Zhouia sp. PK063 TaxID=3373602 RepID=UPI0037BAD45D
MYIFISNLHPFTKQHTLLDIFQKFGVVTSIHLLFDLEGKFLGQGWIKMEKDEDATLAVNTLNTSVLMNRFIALYTLQQL